MKDIEAKIEDVKARNAKINEDIEALSKQRADIDRQTQALRDEAIRQQGEFKVLSELLEAEKTAMVGSETEH